MVAPDIDSESAADAAIELYDQNGDGALDLKELESCRGMLSAVQVYDRDGDKKVSKEEIVDRINTWHDGPAMMTLSCRVTMDGRPLIGAEVQYVPEDYLKDWLPTATGTSGANGVTSISIPAELLPSTHKRLRAIYAGTYRIEVNHPSVEIPSKYNTNTIFGREVSLQTGTSPVQELSLSSK